MQNGNRNESGDIEPNSHIQMSFSSIENRHKHIQSEYYPDNRNQNIDWPFEFGIFFGCCEAKRKRNCSGHYNQLPTPEMNAAQHITPHTRFEQALNGIIISHE